MQTIVYSVNGARYEATVSDRPWLRSLVPSNALTVEHSSCSYVIAVTRDGFEAFPIEEDS